MFSVETRVLILNPDPVFKDRLLSILDLTDWTETRVVRSLSEAVAILIAESCDGFIIEGEPESAVETARFEQQFANRFQSRPGEPSAPWRRKT